MAKASLPVLTIFVLLAVLFASTARVNAAGATIPKNVKFETVVSGLNNPLFVTHAGDGSNRLFIVQRTGQILIYKNNALNATPFLNISSLINVSGGEQGLLGLAFDPNYETSGKFYVVYVKKGVNTIALARYKVSASNPDLADPASRRELLTIAKSYANHNGGTLAFGPDGYLYMSVGDGGGGGDPNGNGQNRNTLLGKILRLNVSGLNYSIPPTNPFIGVPNVRGEIWAYGFRNPWRFSFDRVTNNIFIGDVGQNAVEEVDFQPAASGGGENYGWNILEGNRCYNAATCAPPAGYVPPVAVYDHGTNDSIGCSVTGGYVYRGSRFPSLVGVYLYADFCTGRLWGMVKDSNGQWVSQQIRDTDYSVSSFGEDEQGELYITDYAAGSVLHIAEAPIVTANFLSQAANDGYIVESSENSSQGGVANAGATMIRIGDDASNRQYVGILSFDTANLPDNAILLSVTLTFKKAGTVGSDPFTALDPLQADVRKGYFGLAPTLERVDFQAPASRASVAGILMPLTNQYYRLGLNQTIPFLNKTGLTQLRLYFAVADNNNLTSDYVNIYSGNVSIASIKPRLTVKYYLP